MKIWTFQLKHANLRKECPEPAMKGHKTYRTLNQTLHFITSLPKNTAEINFLINSQHIEVNDITVFLKH